MAYLLIALLVTGSTAARTGVLHANENDVDAVLAALGDPPSSKVWYNPTTWFAADAVGEGEDEGGYEGDERFDESSIDVPDDVKPDAKAELDAGFELLELDGAVDSPYAFGSGWSALNFEERWEQFRNAVPLNELQDTWDPEVHTGPVCHPSSDGPDSEKLAILIHGFTSCPGGLYPLTKRMVEGGFRVLRPVLPGHGRKYMANQTKVCKASSNKAVDISDKCISHFLKYSCNWTKALPQDTFCDQRPSGISREAYQCCCKENLQSLEEGSVPCTGEEIVSEYQDDLSQFPLKPGPYLAFAEALGRLVEQFKKEHPLGQVVVVGHSLGGLIAAKFALERPRLVDRLLLMNPMFALSVPGVAPLLKLGGEHRVSWTAWGTPECDERRAAQGGYCQFYLGHVGALSDLGYIVLCRHWGLIDYCKLRGAQVLGVTAGAGATAGMAAGAAGGAAAGGAAAGYAGAAAGYAGASAGLAAGSGAAATTAAGSFALVGHAAGWTPMIWGAAVAGHVGFATKLAVFQSAVITAAAAKGGAAAATAAALGAGAAKTGAVAGALAGAASGPAAPAAVPVGAIVGAVFASLAVGVAAYIVISHLYDRAATKAAEMVVRNITHAAEVRANFGYLKQVQILTTQDDPAVDNGVMEDLRKVLFGSRHHALWELHRNLGVDKQAAGDVSLAFLPKEVGHGYNNNQFDEDRWFQPYVENVTAAFCLHGQHVPALTMVKEQRFALTDRRQVSADGLLMQIPSFSESPVGGGYYIGTMPATSGTRPGPPGKWVTTMFSGRATHKCESNIWGSRWSYVDVVDPKFKDRRNNDLILVLTRTLRGTITKISVLRSPISMDEKCDKTCITGKAPVIDPNLPLFQQLDNLDLEPKKQKLEDVFLCKDRLASIICERLQCE